MPIARIEVRKSRPPEQVRAMIEAVCQAQIEALKVPDHDRQVRYIEHRPEHFEVPPDKTENFTFVEILMFPGRSTEAKRNLYRAIVERFGALGIAPSDITIVLGEPALANWGLGGVPASEVDLGYSLDV